MSIAGIGRGCNCWNPTKSRHATVGLSGQVRSDSLGTCQLHASCCDHILKISHGYYVDKNVIAVEGLVYAFRYDLQVNAQLISSHYRRFAPPVHDVNRSSGIMRSPENASL